MNTRYNNKAKEYAVKIWAINGFNAAAVKRLIGFGSSRELKHWIKELNIEENEAIHQYEKTRNKCVEDYYKTCKSNMILLCKKHPMIDKQVLCAWIHEDLNINAT